MTVTQTRVEAVEVERMIKSWLYFALTECLLCTRIHDKWSQVDLIYAIMVSNFAKIIGKLMLMLL